MDDLGFVYIDNGELYLGQHPHQPFGPTQQESSHLSFAVIWQVLRKLRRLSWAEHEPYLVRCMLKATKGRYNDLPLVASLSAGLSRYHPSFGVALPDALLEEVGCPHTLRHSQKWHHALILAASLVASVMANCQLMLSVSC